MSTKGKKFGTLTDEWVIERLKTVIDVRQRDVLYYRLKNYILPELWNKPCNVYNDKAMQNIFEKLKSKPETAKRVRGICADIYMFGAKYDPICKDISRIVRSTKIVIEDQDKKRKFLASTNDIDLLRRIYKTAKESEKSQRYMCALQLLMLTCARPKNVRFAKWEEFRLDRKMWQTPSKRTDIEADHVIPLSSQALELLGRIRGLDLPPKGSPYLFPAGDNNVLPDTAFASAMKTMDVGSDTQTAFGMRYSAEAIMKHEYEYGAIDGKELHILIQTFMDAVNPDGKPQYPPEILMTQRAELAQWWADKLEGII